jgi:uncharacterized protein (UPF0332 family)
MDQLPKIFIYNNGIDKEIVFDYKGCQVYFPTKIEYENPKYRAICSFVYQKTFLKCFKLLFSKDKLQLKYQGIVLTVFSDKVILDSYLNRKEMFTICNEQYVHKDFTFTMQNNVFVAKENEHIVLYYDFRSPINGNNCKYTVFGIFSYQEKNNLLNLYKDDVTIFYNYNNIVAENANVKVSATIDDHCVKLNKSFTKTLIL